jgi:hypothetical protein
MLALGVDGTCATCKLFLVLVVEAKEDKGQEGNAQMIIDAFRLPLFNTWKKIFDRRVSITSIASGLLDRPKQN